MKNRSRLTALLLALVMLLSMTPAAALADVIQTVEDYQNAVQSVKDELSKPSVPQEEENSFALTRTVQEESIVRSANAGTLEQEGSYALPLAGRLTLTAPAAEGYQWQIRVGDVWANIVGDNGPSITLTYAKVQNALAAGGAQVRCVLVNGSQLTTSPVATVTVDSTIATETKSVEQTIPVTSFYVPAKKNLVQELNADVLADGDTDTPIVTSYSIIINYLFENGEVAADPYIASLAAGTSFKATVNFPNVQGYLPYYGENQQNSIDLDYSSMTEDVTIDVVYKPTNVNYTVIHYWQNVDNDQYVEHERETGQGLTGTKVPDVKKTYEGFYALVYEQPAIAAAGNTVIEVYYDRNYYLMNFELDGGYGVEPIYARYGAKISVGEPTKAGYTFAGWTLDNAVATLPETMPNQNVTYKALWTAGDTAKVTVVFWGENANEEEYSYIKSSEVYLKPETEFTYSEDHLLICVLEEHTHSANCYKLICNKEEHTHSTSCGYACNKTPHPNHTVNCYSGVGKKANSGGLGKPDNPKEGEVYKGYLDTYIYINGTWYYYTGSVASNEVAPTTCGGLHTHGASCGYACGKTEHTHTGYTGDCYTLICAKTEHTHTADCYMGNAGLESNLWTFVKSDTVTVAADGSSVINVYYDRTEKTLTFKYNYNNNGYNSTETITAKWGSDISVRYKEIVGNAKSTFWSQSSAGSEPYTNYVGIMPQKNTIYYNSGKSGKEGSMTYWGQDQNGQYTIQLFEVTGVGGYTVTNEDRYEFEGFTYDHGTANGTACAGANFYYTRNSYTLTFNDGYEDVKSEKVKYEASLSAYSSFTPVVPSAYEPGSVRFDGWYLNPECTGVEYKLDEHQMPADNVLLYAKWTPVMHTVEFYLDQAAKNAGTKLEGYEDVRVEHGAKVEPVPAEPTNGSYAFVGWFYEENGVEKAFDFANIPVTKDMKVYAKWSSNTLKQYKVIFVLKDSETKVADDLTGSGLAGTTKTFDAKGGTELYSDYQEGYFPTVKSQSLTLDIEADELTLTFEYVQKDAVPYTVKYINTETNTSVFDGIQIEDKVVEDNKKAVVTETFKPISGFIPDAYQKRLVVTADGENILYFYYTKDTTHAYYKITHYTENLAPDAQGNRTWTEYASSQAIGDIGTTYTADSINIPGFTFDRSVEGTVLSGELKAEGLELKLYYTRNSYPYEVRYLEYGTGKELHAPKQESAKYGQIVSEEAIGIEHYECVTASPQTLNIKVEEDEKEAKLNILIFYYQEKQATINYVAVGPEGYNEDGTPKETVAGKVEPSSEAVKVLSGNANGSTATADAPTYRFAGWYDSEGNLLSMDAKYTPVRPGSTIGDDGNVTGGLWPEEGVTYYAKFEYNLTTLTITKTGCADIDNGQSFLFKVEGYGLPNGGLVIAINGNGSETISGLTVGQEYTVTEITEWSWRYTPDSSHTIKLEADASQNSVEIHNEREKTYWLDGDCYKENNFGN